MPQRRLQQDEMNQNQHRKFEPIQTKGKFEQIYYQET
jgi:hypothetical protein